MEWDEVEGMGSDVSSIAAHSRAWVPFLTSLISGFLICEMQVTAQSPPPRMPCGLNETWHARNI